MEYEEIVEMMLANSLCSCMLLLLTCLGEMQGYEAVWTDFSALKYDVQFCETTDDYSAISWPIVGCFKSHDGITG